MKTTYKYKKCCIFARFLCVERKGNNKTLEADNNISVFNLVFLIIQIFSKMTKKRFFKLRNVVAIAICLTGLFYSNGASAQYSCDSAMIAQISPAPNNHFTTFGTMWYRINPTGDSIKTYAIDFCRQLPDSLITQLSYTVWTGPHCGSANFVQLFSGNSCRDTFQVSGMMPAWISVNISAFVSVLPWFLTEVTPSSSPFITAVANTTSFGREGGTTIVTVTSNVPWEAKISNPADTTQISINPAIVSAATPQGLQGTITLQPNMTTAPRTFTIFFFKAPSDGLLMTSLQITQTADSGVYGCTDPQASNYNPLATVSNGLCVYGQDSIYGCMDSTALNYNPQANMPNGSCVYPYITAVANTTSFGREGGTTNVSVASNVPWRAEYYPATMGSQISINPQVSSTFSPQGFPAVITVQPNSTTAPRTFLILFSRANINGGIALDTLIITQTADSGVYGCTDPQASNYNPLATVDNGLCVYGQDSIYGCMDSTAINYNPQANMPDGSCVYPYINVSAAATFFPAGGGDTGFTISSNVPWILVVSPSTLQSAISFNPPAGTAAMPQGVNGSIHLEPNPTTAPRTFTILFYRAPNGSFPYDTLVITQAGATVYGCTDPFAENYNPNATANDGSCTYKKIESPISGCMDSLALNYSPVATISDDSSCIYPSSQPQIIPGCTDPKSLNYNPLATVYDGSCVYASDSNTHVGGGTGTPIDTVGTRPIENCALKTNLQIIDVSISRIDVLNPHEVKVHWVITLEGDIVINYPAVYTVEQSGLTLFYLSIICKEEQKSTSQKANTNITGFTISATYDVNLKSTGIVSAKSNNPLRVYPNPTTGQLTIGGDLTVDNYSIYNVVGQIVMQGTLKNNTINIESLTNGIYYLKIADTVVKVVKQ